MRVRILTIGLLVGWFALVGCSSSKPLVAADKSMAVTTAKAPKLPAIFGDNMVLQQGKSIPVWGWAEPGQTVAVTLGSQQKKATVGDDGKWLVKLNPVKAGGPYEMAVEASSKMADRSFTGAVSSSLSFKNILVGEVWVCSGQSNMEMQLKNAQNAEQVIAEAKYPKIRLFTVKKAQSATPLTDVEGKWEECTPQTAPSFSAVGYFFGRDLHQILNVPVGLIHTSWGGTAVEAWTSRSVLDADPDAAVVREEWDAQQRNYTKAMENYQAAMEKYKADKEQAERDGKPAPKAPQRPWGPVMPTMLYNAMVAPIVQYGIAGAIWYQGESNAGAAIRYTRQFPAMIKNWRDAWGQGDFPFLFVQLANFMARDAQPVDSNWAELREAQLKTLSLSKTGMAVIIDIGEEKDIHPRNKLDVGHRLALAAESVAYGKKLVYSGPIYDSMKVDGDTVCLKFKHVGSGLMSKEDQPLKGFAIAGSDKKFVWADAKIDGNTVIVSSKQISQPVAVRYGWGNNPDCTLYNKEDLPASPFRTDNWTRQGAK